MNMNAFRHERVVLFMLILLLTGLLSAACEPERSENVSTQAASGTDPVLNRTSVPTVVGIAGTPEAGGGVPETTSPRGAGERGKEVGAACPFQDQSAALLLEEIPDWQSLMLSTCYDLDLALAPGEENYHGSGRIMFTNNTGSQLSDLVFRTYPNSDLIYGGELLVNSALVNGEPVSSEVFLSDRTAVRLRLREPLGRDDRVVVELEFTGTHPANFGASSRVYGVFNYVPAEQVLTLANWYPLLAPWRDGSWDVDAVIGIGDAVVSQTALFEVSITAPAGWQVVATGSQVLEESLNGQTRRKFVSGPVRDFTISASPNFVLREARAGDVQVRHWGLPDGEERWNEALQSAVDALSLFAERYGPYPYAELDVVAVPLQLAAGVEYPGVVLMATSQYRENAESPFLLGIVVSHEVAHQWWYAVVGNDVLSDPWLDESLATFSSLLYQQVYQPRYYPGTLRFYQNRVSELEAEANSTEINQPLSAFQNRPGEYSPVVYTKGALFFVELRERLGDEAFFEGMQSYYGENRYEIALPAELLSAFETGCSCQLHDFYAEWGLP
jgi:hypothetical protein